MKKTLSDKSKIALNKQFVFQEDTIDILSRNILSGQNTILYGKGGYGKSQVTKAVCTALDIPYITIQCYRDMPVEAFIGSLNMTAFKKESKYEINFKDSPFMYEGVLILEEFMDVDPDITSAIKDIIEEKGYRDRDTFIPYKTLAIVGLGNTAPKEIAVTESARALYFDRFISHINVEWESVGPEEYFKLLQTAFPMTSNLIFVAHLASEAVASPRAALQAAAMVHNNSIENPITVLSSMHIFKSLDINHLFHLHNERLTKDPKPHRNDWAIREIQLKPDNPDS